MSDDETQSGPWGATELLTGGWNAAKIDTSVAHPARMYDYFLGGRSLYAHTTAGGTVSVPWF